MELFYSKNISTGGLTLDSEESNHCIRVLRHKEGDIIHIVDGCGTLYKCVITDASPKELSFRIEEKQEGYGSHPYRLHAAVAPPKNIDRFEWFAEKATEIGVNEITPLFGEYSERKVFKPERIERILISAAKQSHKAAVPVLHAPSKVSDFLVNISKETAASDGGKKGLFICYCDDVSMYGVKKIPLTEAIKGYHDIIVMIGPEGDFSRDEIQLAIHHGWQPVSLGDSRLRIETAAITAVAAVYLSLL